MNKTSLSAQNYQSGINNIKRQIPNGGDMSKREIINLLLREVIKILLRKVIEN